MNNSIQHIAAFDFDGTISQDDTLFAFLRSTHGAKFYLWFALLLPVLVAYKVGILSNKKAKQIVISCFYKGWSIERFNAACDAFAPTIATRPRAIQTLRQHFDQGHTVVIVSASPENWVKAWARLNDVVIVLATKLETDNGKLTGRFASPNCHGAEKVIRLIEQFPDLQTDRTSIHLTAYGDSSGDQAMIDFADEGHFKKF